MDCKDFENHILTDYLDGLLPEKEKETLETHLQGCAACRELLATVQATMAPLREAERLTPPPHLWQSIRKQVNAEERPSPSRTQGFRAWLRSWITLPEPALATAAVVSILLATTLLLRNGTQEMGMNFDAGAQIDYMAAMLDNEVINLNGDSEGLGTAIEEYFL